MMRVRSFLKREDGAAAVEFAILVPFLLLMTFGIIYFSFLFGVSHSLQLVASEATRASVRGVSSAERLQLAQAALDDALENNPLLDLSRIDPEIVETTTPFPGLVITLTYDLDGSLATVLPFVGSAVGQSIVREAYIAY